MNLLLRISSYGIPAFNGEHQDCLIPVLWDSKWLPREGDAFELADFMKTQAFKIDERFLKDVGYVVSDYDWATINSEIGFAPCMYLETLTE